jgi:hypothetical protein
MLLLIRTIIWWGSAALLIAIDSNYRKKKVDPDPNAPDLSDKSVAPWLLVAAVAGSLVFPFYFYSTRKSLIAALLGVLLVPVFVIGVNLLSAGLYLGVGALL